MSTTTYILTSATGTLTVNGSSHSLPWTDANGTIALTTAGSTQTTFTFTPAQNCTASGVVVGSGSTGSTGDDTNGAGAGGGAGGHLTFSGYAVTAGTPISILVGKAKIAANRIENGAQSRWTTTNTYVAKGGGEADDGSGPGNGGSGGGDATTGTGGAGTAGQGYAGGGSPANGACGGGGGGANAVGSAGSGTTGGAGGAGVTDSIVGLCCGGGGGDGTTGGAGGNSGSGNSAAYVVAHGGSINGQNYGDGGGGIQTGTAGNSAQGVVGFILVTGAAAPTDDGSPFFCLAG